MVGGNRCKENLAAEPSEQRYLWIFRNKTGRKTASGEKDGKKP